MSQTRLIVFRLEDGGTGKEGGSLEVIHRVYVGQQVYHYSLRTDRRSVEPRKNHAAHGKCSRNKTSCALTAACRVSYFVLLLASRRRICSCMSSSSCVRAESLMRSSRPHYAHIPYILTVTMLISVCKLDTIHTQSTHNSRCSFHSRLLLLLCCGAFANTHPAAAAAAVAVSARVFVPSKSAHLQTSFQHFIWCARRAATRASLVHFARAAATPEAEQELSE